jgi:hypothetical protein
VFLCARSDLSGGDGAFLLHDLFLGEKPVLEVVTVFPAACLVEFLRALADLDVKFLGFAQHRRGRFLCRIFGHGATLLAVMASRLTGGGQNCRDIKNVTLASLA